MDWLVWALPERVLAGRISFACSSVPLISLCTETEHAEDILCYVFLPCVKPAPVIAAMPYEHQNMETENETRSKAQDCEYLS